MALSYFINRKQTTCVITFSGSLTPNDTEILSACLKEATSESYRYIILNLGGIKTADPAASRPFTLFQQALRGNSRLYLCDLQLEPARILKAEGVVRESEAFPDLMACLQAIITEEKG
ncbi:MAG: STAS domain-containing protein [Bdellovibrionota bacterium]